MSAITTNGHLTNGNVANGSIATTTAVEKPIMRLDNKLQTLKADHRIHGSMVGLSEKELSNLYNEFAEEYEKAYSNVEYEGPRNVAHILKDNLPSHLTPATTRIFDAGCGTGMIGDVLYELGFKEVHGVDFSAGMLKICAKKGYSSLTEANLMEPLQFDSDSFDAVVSCGVFTAGHVKKEGLLELIRITRKGGILSIGSQELVYESDGYPAFIKDLESKNLVKNLGLRKVYTMKKVKTEMTVMVLEVL